MVKSQGIRILSINTVDKFEPGHSISCAQGGIVRCSPEDALDPLLPKGCPANNYRSAYAQTD